MTTKARTRPLFRKLASDQGTFWTAVGAMTRQDLRDLCRAYDITKAASIGGEQEQGFEQAFSSLAYAYMKDKAPRLIDFIVGFQLVDRNEDNTKAVGVFGFKVGKQWLYAPVFFLNGDLKGHELLYIKNQDSFVPMKENWVNYIMSRKPHVLGEGSQRDVFQLGGLMPNLDRMNYPPTHGKFGSDSELSKLAEQMGQTAAAAAPAAAPKQAPSNSSTQKMPQAQPAAAPAPAPVAPAPAPAAPPVQPSATSPGAPANKKLNDVMAAMGVGPNELAILAQQAAQAASRVGMPPAAPAPAAPAAPAPAPVTPPAAAPSVPSKMPQPSSQTQTAAKTAAAGLFDEWSRHFAAMLAACHIKKASFLHRDLPGNLRLSMVKLAADPFKAALAPLDLCLPDFLASDWRLANAAFDMTQKYPGIKLAFDRFYGKNFFKTIALRCKAAADQISIIPAPRPAAVEPVVDGMVLPRLKMASADSKVKIVTDADVAITQNLPDLDDESKKQILNHGYLVKDERTGEEISIAYNTQVKQVLTNPHESGIYEVLEKPGTFDRMLVILHPTSNQGSHDFCTVIRLGDGEKSWLNAHGTGVYARKVELTEDYQKWFDGLAAGKLSKGATYIAINAAGEGTIPFTVAETFPDSDYELYKVNFKDYPAESRSASLPQTMPSSDPYGPYISNYGAKLIVAARKGTKLRAVNGELHVPENFKFLKLKDPPKPKKDNDDDSPKAVDCCGGSGGSGSDPQPISCGNIDDIQLLFTEKTAHMKLYGDNNEVTISTMSLGHQRGTYKQALFALIRSHGLAEKQAEDMLKETQRRRVVTYRVKYADGYPFGGGGPTAPVIPAPSYGTEQMGYNSVRSIYPQEENLPVPGLEASMTDPRIYDPFLNITPDQSALATAQQAGQSGQKEVFDTAMISGMLKAVRQDTLVDRYLGDLMKGVDKLGRLLFMFYWHQEEFADRYGKGDLPELEDSLRNAFETLGDVVLFLKEKTIEPGLDEISDPSIEESARN